MFSARILEALLLCAQPTQVYTVGNVSRRLEDLL
jgi:hypothetical protein